MSRRRDQEQIDWPMAMSLRAEGKLQREVAKIVGCGPQAISRYEKKLRGECRWCSELSVMKPDGTRSVFCAKHLLKHTARCKKIQRTPRGWANHKAGVHRTRVREHNAENPDHPLQEFIVDGPALLARVIAHGSDCGLCGKYAGFPWEHIGDPERGADVDHILSMWAIINEGRQDWASVSNVRLLCIDCHREEGVRLKRQDIEEKAHMDHMLGKDKT